MIGFIRFTCVLYLLTFSVQAADYYICSNGNDANDGLSHATAWKTYAKANSIFSSLNGGDSILFCEGAVFVKFGEYRWANFNSTSINRITISSYAPPNSDNITANPIIYAADGGSAFRISEGGNADHDEGYIISNLILRGEIYGGNGIFIFNDADSIDIIDVEIYNFSIGIHAAGSNAANAGSDGKNSDLKILRAYIHDNNAQGFLGSGDNLVIEDSIFINNGFELAVFNHNIYISGGDGSTSNETIRNNKLYLSAMFGGKCSGASLVSHGDHINLLIENNTVWEDADATSPGCWGIAIDNGYNGNKPEEFPGLIIRGNTVVNMRNIGIGCAACRDAIIENNTIVHQAPFGITAIRVPDRDENSFFPGLPKSNNVTVRNNVVMYDSSGSGVGINLGDGDGATYASVGNDTYYRPGFSMDLGCESYHLGDVVNVSAGICQNSIPQNLLNAALDKTVLPTSYLIRSVPIGIDSTDDEGAGGFGGYFLSLLATVLAIKWGRLTGLFRSILC